MEILKSFTLSFTAIFVALDIIGTLPMYAGMTREMQPQERQRVLSQSMVVAFLVALAFLLLGQRIFQFLGITLFDFRIAGGLVLLLVSLTDLIGGPHAVKSTAPLGAPDEPPSTGIVPLAVPLITGPGVITQVVLQVGAFGYVVTLFALLANYLLAWVFLRKSDVLARLLGRDTTVVISKIAALLLAAIAISMMRGGIFDAIRDFRGQ